jgi:serine protease
MSGREVRLPGGPAEPINIRLPSTYFNRKSAIDGLSGPPQRGDALVAVNFALMPATDSPPQEMLMSKRVLSLVALAAVVACQDATTPVEAPFSIATPQPALVPGAQGAAEQVMPGRVLARFVDGFTPEEVAGPLGLAVAGRGYGNSFVILRGAVGNERALAAMLDRDPRVMFAEPDYLRQTTVDDRLWAFYNPGGLTVTYTRGGNRGQTVSSFTSKADADQDIGPDVGETYGAGGETVKVGSIDTGVQFDHPEFVGVTLINGHDWYSNDANSTDEDGHGTHTTGTMVGTRVGVAGATGATGNVQVYVQRVCGPQGCPTSAIANAIRAAADNGVVAMNLSLSGSSESQAEKDAIVYALGKNALVIASAGNGGTGTVGCPACDPNAISVGATNWLDELTYYTNWGSGLAIVAPGGQLYSNTTEEGGILSAYLGGGLRYLQGTSMSAPQVTGTAGVVASKQGPLTAAALRARLLGSTDELGSSGYDTNFGCGRLNTFKAVTSSSLSDCDPTSPGGGGLNAAFSVSCGGSATCSFNASTSTGATSYAWDFGDGDSGSGVTASHTYVAAGSYVVELTASNGPDEDTATRTVVCTVKGPQLRCK